VSSIAIGPKLSMLFSWNQFYEKNKYNGWKKLSFKINMPPFRKKNSVMELIK